MGCIQAGRADTRARFADLSTIALRPKKTSSEGREHAPTILMTTSTDVIIDRAAAGAALADEEALALSDCR